MPIKTFSEEEKAAIKAEASTRFQGRAMVIHLDDPISETVVMAPFDRAYHQTFWHATLKDKQSAYASAWVERRLWPGLGEMAAIQQAWAAAPEKVAERLDAQALGAGGRAIERVWTAPTEAEEAAVMARAAAADAPPDWTGILPRGLSLEAARDVVAKAGRVRLWLVSNAAWAVVLRTPDPQQWIAASAAFDAALRKGKGAIDAVDPFLLDVVAWASEPLTGGGGLLDRHPDIWFSLWGTYKIAGGEGAAARTFLL